MPFVKLTVLFTIAAKLLARLNLAQATSRLWPPSLLTYGVMMSGVLVTASVDLPRPSIDTGMGLERRNGKIGAFGRWKNKEDGS